MADELARVLIVSNRLPVTVVSHDGVEQLEPSAGGLATGLQPLHERSTGRWVGWPGAVGELSPALAKELAARRFLPVSLSEEELQRYYQSYSNGILWPLFHYLPDRLPLKVPDWEAYEKVNARFAEAAAAAYSPGDRIWVHDYQLTLAPRMLRERLPEASIGFFLHIPFPDAEDFQVLPDRARILEGLLGANLVGFHTAAYMRHFAAAVLRVLGVASEVDVIPWEGRRVHLGVFPMGIDAAAWASKAGSTGADTLGELKGDPESRLLVGIDRLDYTKGLIRRLLAYELLLERHEELRGKVRLVQVAVPTRTEVESYRDYRHQMDEVIGRIQGRFATPRWVPIHYLYRGLSEEEVVALYRAADVMLVTPLRDGMNLVAKEFVACRVDEDGVLLLSEFAGAAAELAEAVQVNPFDVEGTAEALHRALTMPEDERKTRMQGLRRRVLTYDLYHWVRSFLGQLSISHPRLEGSPSPPQAVEKATAFARRAHQLTLLLDYDGTLVPIAGTPHLARPDREALSLLAALAARPRTQLHVVSGRPRPSLERWLGELPIALHAEHGFWSRLPGGNWTHLAGPAADAGWIPRVEAILEEFAARTPGSLVERKSASVAWHYRMSDPEFGDRQAKELRLHLTELLSNEPVEVVAGAKNVEVRPHAIHKGRVAQAILAAAEPGTVFLAMGDDRTDEDLFAVFPEPSLTVKVGVGPTQARLVLEDVPAARAFLAALL